MDHQPVTDAGIWEVSEGGFLADAAVVEEAAAVEIFSWGNGEEATWDSEAHVGSIGIEETFELTDTGGVAHFPEGLGFDLSDTLTGDLEALTDFLEGSGVPIEEAEAEGEDLLFTWGEGGEDIAEAFFEEGIGGHFARALSGFVFDEVTEVGIIAIADGALEGDRLLGHFEDGADTLWGEVHFLCDFLWGGLTAEVLDEFFLNAHELIDGFDHMDGDTDGAGLIGDGAGDGLSDPPSCVG